MKKNLLLSLACSLIGISSLQAQSLDKLKSKLPEQLLRSAERGHYTAYFDLGQQDPKNSLLKNTTHGQELSVIISTTNSKAASSELAKEGIRCTIITDHTMTASVTADQLSTIADNEYVTYVNETQQLRPVLENTRKVIGADMVQSGSGLESPFTGKGVLVGIIDQGFMWRHVGFLDSVGKPRPVQIWNHGIQGTHPTTSVPFGKDSFDDSGGHATHVANIAAGTKVNEYYGIAPNANLYLVSSTFSTSDILSEVNAIHDYAKKHNMPCVVNMSFGSQIGPHDGSRPYDKTIGDIIAKSSEGKNPRFFVCAAMGNEGHSDIHAFYRFTNKSQPSSVKLLPTMNAYRQTAILGTVWSNANDGIEHLEFDIFLSKDGGRTRIEMNPQDKNNYVQQGIDPNNKKQYLYFRFPKEIITKNYGETARVFIKVTSTAGNSFHAWLEPGFGTWEQTFPNYTINDQYLVGEGAASIDHCFAVAAFGATDFDGKVFSGPIASFSSPGPWLGEEEKPTVAAPGVNVISAYNSLLPGFEPATATASIEKFNRTYYYGKMSGTSMATPVVTGTVALWLEANPSLTYDQIIEIFKKASKKDKHTKETPWSRSYGYGKLDAYAGIKEALKLKSTGINSIENSKQPLTIDKELNTWRILFNNDESFAHINVYNTTGQRVFSKEVSQPRTGNEVVVDLSNYSPGIYVINIETSQSRYTRKMIVTQ